MKRLTAYIKNKVADLKAANREKRVYIALEAAKANVENDKLQAQLELEEILSKFEEGNIEECIQQMVDKLVAIEDAEHTLDIIDKVDKYLNEEVTTD